MAAVPFKSTNRGVTLLTAVIASALVGFATVIFVRSAAQAKQATRDRMETLKAELYALELLEGFQSMRESGLKTYLARNPISGSTDANELYALCAHINIQDRMSPGGPIMNPDLLANLAPDEGFGVVASSADTPNRFYQVHVMDMTTLAVNTVHCNLAPPAIVLGPNEKFFVTVGVTWKNRNSQLHRVAMSAPIL